MEQTNRQVVSDIISGLKSLNIDDRISNRLVLSRVKDKARVFIKQDSDSRRLFKITDIWKTVKCFPMCKVDLVECGLIIPNCEHVMKSIKEIPKAFDTSYGTMIRVFNVDGSKEYKQTKLGDYQDIKNREFQNPNIKYFWVNEGHIFIPDSEVVQIMVSGLFEWPEEVDILNGVKDAECAAPLDAYFPCPGHLLDAVKKDALVELAKIYKGIVEDAKPDMNPNNK